MPAESWTVFCIVDGETSSFPVDIPKDRTVGHLKDAIKRKKAIAFANIDADKLTLYKINIPEDAEFEGKLKDLFNAEPPPELLNPTKKLKAIFESSGPAEDTAHILVQLPRSGDRQEPSPRVAPEVESALNFFTKTVQTYTLEDLRHPRNNMHLNVKSVQSSPFLYPDTGPNYEPPDFVKRYIEILGEKRPLKTDQQELLRHSEHLKLIIEDGIHFNVSETLSSELREFDTYSVHLRTHSLDLDYVKGASSAMKEGHSTAFLVDRALIPPPGGDHPWRYDKNVGWDPLLLQGEFGEPGATKVLYKFKPRSDFSLFRDVSGPLILGEIISDSKESDRWRMLFEGAAVCRYQNLANKNREAIILCLYLNKDYQMERFLVYQLPDTTRDVFILHDSTLDLANFQDAFLLSKQLFNFRDYAKMIPDMSKERKEEMKKILNTLEEDYSRSVTAARKSKGSRGHPPSQGPSNLDNIPEDANLQAKFRGIHVLNYAHKTVATAIRRSDLQPVVLKRVRTNSSESRILLLLQSYSLRNSSYIIPLLEVIGSPPGTSTLVMPRYTPIIDLEGVQADELALQLISGVDWLHKQLISHSDIKATNLVFDEGQRRLFIIDFGLAVKLTSREQKVRGARGTPEHVAPEVGIESSWENHLQEVTLDEDSVYSPILADVWAVGDVVRYFQEWFQTSTENIRQVVEKVARELQAVDPTKRLSLRDAERQIVGTRGMAVTMPGPPVEPFRTPGSHPVSMVVALQA